MLIIEELFNISPQLSFHENDLSEETYASLKIEVEKLANQYYDSPFSRYGRTLDEIRINTWNGMVAEKYLIESHGFEQNLEKYRDLKKNTFKIEIKTSTTLNSKNKILKKLHTATTKHDHVLMFNRNGKEYQIESYHQYDPIKKEYNEIENYGVYNV